MRYLIWGGLLALLGGVAAAGATLEGINNAEVCGRCHRDILTAWKSSAHAKALENPRFQDAMERAVDVAGAAARQTCLSCHAPTVRFSGDQALKTKASWEGVTCDFCHSLKSVTLGPGNPTLKVTFDGTKTGPLRDASSIAHGTLFSDVHTSSLVCAGCHEYQNRKGFGALTTYSEWEQSRYGREAMQCQQCHMAETSAQVVDPKVKRLSRATVNLHEMPGSRSIDMLNQAVQLRLSTEREPEELVVQVEVRNRGAGHMVPTGSPLRQLHLEVSARTNGKSYSERRVYQKRVADQKGTEIENEELVFLEAAKVLEDTRLKPDEVRREAFRFPIAAGKGARIHARLWYYYAPEKGGSDTTRVNFLTLPHYEPARRTSR